MKDLYFQKFKQEKYRNEGPTPGLNEALDLLTHEVVLGYEVFDSLSPEAQAATLLLCEASADERGNLWDRAHTVKGVFFNANASAYREGEATGRRILDLGLWEVMPLGGGIRGLLAPGRVSEDQVVTSLSYRDHTGRAIFEVDEVPVTSCLFYSSCEWGLDRRACVWCSLHGPKGVRTGSV